MAKSHVTFSLRIYPCREVALPFALAGMFERLSLCTSVFLACPPRLEIFGF